MNTFSVAGKELQAKGHHVILLTMERNRHIVEKAGIPGIFHKPINSQTPSENYKTIEESFLMTGVEKFFRVKQFYESITSAFLEFCREITLDKETMNMLRQHKFNIALVDGSTPAWCLYNIPYKMNISYLSFTPAHFPWMMGLPAMPSSEGILGIHLLPSNPSFFMRIVSLALYCYSYITLPLVHKDQHILEMSPEMPATTYSELFKASGVVFVNQDNTCMDYPRLEAPNYHFIGGLGASPAKPLEQPFADFINKAEHGVIVVSFGSFIKRVPDAMMLKMLPVFDRLQQRIIMRCEGDFQNVPSNVMLTKWLPQNDLLGHPSIKVFITHGGLNGQMEGRYHGIPMITMPLGADQDYNAKRAHDKKFGIMMDPFSFTSDDLRKAILEILNNDEYTNAIKKCSRISKQFPNAHDTIHFWIEHVLEFGSEHLKPMSMDMPLWKLFMFDVLLFVLIIDIIICYVAYRCCKCCYRRCPSGRPNKPKVE